MLIKGIGQSAPSHIAGEYLLFSRRSLSAVIFQCLQELDSFYIHAKLGFFAANTQIIINDAKVFNGQLW